MPGFGRRRLAGSCSPMCLKVSAMETISEGHQKCHFSGRKRHQSNRKEQNGRVASGQAGEEEESCRGQACSQEDSPGLLLFLPGLDQLCPPPPTTLGLQPEPQGGASWKKTKQLFNNCERGLTIHQSVSLQLHSDLSLPPEHLKES